ncbi:MAG: hypothetical protein JO180_11465 [Gemmatirosa sp.]|nr:hypothetical protein [Gemmatirosa sp.]
MSRWRSYVTTMVLASTVAVLPRMAAAQASAPAAAVDLTGKWQFSVTTDAGTGTPTVVLTQRGDSLTGHYSSQVLGEADVRGTVKDRRLTLSFTASVQGTSLVVTYAGTVESNDALKGSVDIGGQATGTFTAKRQ